MSTSIMVHGMTSARAERITPSDGEPDWAAYRVFSGSDLDPDVTIVVKTSQQADALIKAGFAALGLLTAGEDGAA